MVKSEVFAIKDDEAKKLLREVNQKYGYDFSEYSGASLKRRINRIFIHWKFKSFSQFLAQILDDHLFFKHFLQEITVNVTEMFRDPGFFKALTEEVFPELKKEPFIRIWHAGCSTGEEVYSLAILLKEHGLLSKSRLYATDINSKVIASAKNGVFPLQLMKTFSTNYHQAGGKDEFSKYYTAIYNKAVFDEDLQKHMTFALHNLVSDQSFNEFNLILCRNVLIYFDKSLQNKVVKLFADSLVENGFLALGKKESVRFTSSDELFQIFNKEEKIWRKNDGFST